MLVFQVENNKITGDVDFENVKDLVGSITPVPRGCPVTILSLAKNLVKSAKYKVLIKGSVMKKTSLYESHRARSKDSSFCGRCPFNTAP